jgi:septal ring factor EnvC (AmiA/AmiB activator)
MTQTITSTDATVAALQESVRHNEKNIDKLDRDLKDFRSEVLKQFEKVNDQSNQLETKFEQRFDKVDQRFSQIDLGVIITVDKRSRRNKQYGSSSASL